MQLQYMKPLPGGARPKVLLLGNGIHRIFHTEDFAELLKNVGGKSFTDEDWKYLCNAVPYPLLAVIASGDHLGSKMPEKGKEMTTQKIPQAELELLQQLTNKELDAILTTDYTYEIEEALISDFKCGSGKGRKYRYSTRKEKAKEEDPEKGKSPNGESKKKIRALYTYMGTQDHSVPPIWHIHGEAAKPDSMVLGHYYYGNLVGYLREYIAEAVRRYKISEKNGTEFYPRSWVDYLLFGDVTIIGQGMSLCEMDLWWLVNCKKKNGCGTITHYEPTYSLEKKLLAEAYGINVVMEEIGSDGYEGYYRRILERI